MTLTQAQEMTVPRQLVTNVPGGAAKVPGVGVQRTVGAEMEEKGDVMPVMTDETSKAEPARDGIMSRISMPEFWGALAIIAIWLAVLFDGVFGADSRVHILRMRWNRRMSSLPASRAMATNAVAAASAAFVLRFMSGTPL
jgi:hypothetical protein